jgi:hypothetical protein
VSAGLVTSLIGVGAGAIALWIAVRFPGLTPNGLSRVILHVVASTVLGYAVSPLFQGLVDDENPRQTLFAVFGVAFPTIVYCLLAGVWMIKLAQQTLGGHLR